MVYIRQNKGYKEICLMYDLSKQLWRERTVLPRSSKKYICLLTHVLSILTVLNLTHFLGGIFSFEKGKFWTNNIVILAI